MVVHISDASICKTCVDGTLRVKYMFLYLFCDSPGSYKSRLFWLQGYMHS